MIIRILLFISAVAVAKLRVAYVHQGLPIGGVESSILNVCKYSERIEPKVILVGVKSDMSLLPLVESYCHSVRHFEAREKSANGTIHWHESQVQKLIMYLQVEVDLVFVYFGGRARGEELPLGIYAGQQAKKPVVARVEWRVQVPPCLPLAAIEISTPYILRLQLGGPGYHSVVAGAGVEVLPLEKRTRNTIRIGRLSRLVIEKDPYSFVLAAPLIARELRDLYGTIEFLIAGDGPERSKLEALAKEVDANISFVGALVNRSQVHTFLSSLDLFLYSTMCDSFGYAPAEAMAAAVPIVATRVCSLEDLIEDGVTGLLVDPVRAEHFSDQLIIGEESAKAHAAAAIAILQLPEDSRLKMGRKARDFVERTWSIPAYMDKHASLLEDVVAKHTQEQFICPNEQKTRWIVIPFTVLLPSSESDSALIACAIFPGQENLSHSAAFYIESCPILRSVCASTAARDTCIGQAAQRLSNLAKRTDTAVVVDGPQYEEDLEGPIVDLAIAHLWSPHDQEHSVVPGSKIPLVAATADGSQLPSGWRVCVFAAATSPEVFFKPSDGADDDTFVCTKDTSTILANESYYADDSSRASILLPPVYLRLSVHDAGSLSLLAVATDEKGVPRPIGPRAVAHVRVLPAAETSAVPFPVEPIVLRAGTAQEGKSRIEMYDVPGVPFTSRRAVLQRVAYDRNRQALTIFVDECTAANQSDIPSVLGRLRSGAPVGSWTSVRLVDSTYNTDYCSTTITRPVYVNRFIQPLPNQYHVLYTFLAALLASKLRHPETSPLLLLDKAMSASTLFPPSTDFHDRVLQQIKAIGFSQVALWDHFLATFPSTNTMICFDQIFVASDERDAIQGYINQVYGLLPDGASIQHGSQLERSATALRYLRSALLQHFVGFSSQPRKLYDPKVRVTVIERRETRRFLDLSKVVQAVERGCDRIVPEHCVVQSVALEDMSYEEQITLFANDTDVLVGMEGQGMANMIYMRDGAGIVLLVPPGFDQAVVDYGVIAVALGMHLETSISSPFLYRRFGYFEDMLYWSQLNTVVDLDTEVIANAVSNAVDRSLRTTVAVWLSIAMKDDSSHEKIHHKFRIHVLGSSFVLNEDDEKWCRSHGLNECPASIREIVFERAAAEVSLRRWLAGLGFSWMHKNARDFIRVRDEIDYTSMLQWSTPGFQTNYLPSIIVALNEILTGGPVDIRPSFDILEVGSFAGSNAIAMYHLFGPETRITCIDAWPGVLDGESLTSFDAEALFDKQTHDLAPDAHIKKIKGWSSTELARLLDAHLSYDFIFVDGSHELMPVLVDATLAWRLLRPGGVAIFDDYDWIGPGGDSDFLRPKLALDHFQTAFAHEIDGSCFSVPNGPLFCRRRRRTAEPGTY